VPPSGGPIVSDYANDHAIRRKNMDMDQAFIDMMVPHHQAAVEMAKIAQQRATHEELRTLADYGPPIRSIEH